MNARRREGFVHSLLEPVQPERGGESHHGVLEVAEPEALGPADERRDPLPEPPLAQPAKLPLVEQPARVRALEVGAVRDHARREAVSHEADDRPAETRVELNRLARVAAHELPEEPQLRGTYAVVARRRPPGERPEERDGAAAGAVVPGDLAQHRAAVRVARGEDGGDVRGIVLDVAALV